MLHNQHHKAGLELQRKIESLKADGLDPTVPQKPDISAHTSTRSNSIWQAPATVLGPLNPSRPASPHLRLGDSQAVDESFMLLGGQRVRLIFQLALRQLIFPSQSLGTHSTTFGTSCKEC